MPTSTPIIVNIRPTLESFVSGIGQPNSSSASICQASAMAWLRVSASASESTFGPSSPASFRLCSMMATCVRLSREPAVSSRPASSPAAM